jgi:hypothetical protein
MIFPAKNVRSENLLQIEPLQDAAPVSLLLCASLLGLLLGFRAVPPEQRGMHGSLVLAEIVKYPPQSPMSAYFLDSWTAIHQLGALLLRGGLHQAYVNECLFIVPCALLVCAYAMIVYGFTGRFFLSLLVASLCYINNPLADFFGSPDYPFLGLVWNLPTEHTFGLWAQIGAAWVIGCVAGGRLGLAGFSSLALVAVHPILGAYMAGLLVITTVFVGAAYLKLDMRGFVKGIIWGTVLAIVSFAFFFSTRSGFSASIDHGAFDTYMRVWDVHRTRPVTVSAALRIGAAAVLSIGALSAFVLFIRSRPFATLTSALVVLAVITSTIAYYSVHLAPNLLPDFVTRAAPGRLLNVQAYVSLPLALALGLSIPDHLIKKLRTTTYNRILELVCMVALVVVIIIGFVHAARTARGSIQKDGEEFWDRVRSAGVSGLVLEWANASAPTLYHGHLPIALYAESFDFIPYLPQTAGAVARIVEEGYGVSFYDPPLDMRYRAGLAPRAVQQYWSQLASHDWCRISRDIGIVAVVAPSEWKVGLPVLVPGSEFTLYKIMCMQEDSLQSGAQ